SRAGGAPARLSPDLRADAARELLHAAGLRTGRPLEHQPEGVAGVHLLPQVSPLRRGCRDDEPGGCSQRSDASTGAPRRLERAAQMERVAAAKIGLQAEVVAWNRLARYGCVGVILLAPCQQQLVP